MRKIKGGSAKNFIIIDTWLDEDEEYHEGDPMNLKVFIDGLKSSKHTKWNTFEDLMNLFKK